MITNQNVLPATQVVEPSVAGLVTPSATDLATLLPSTEHWSYQEFGSAQFTIFPSVVGSHSVSITCAQQGNFAAAAAPVQHFTVTQ